MTDPAALVVVQKIPGQSLDMEKDVDDQEFKPALRVVLTKTFSVEKKTGGTHQEDVYTEFNVKIADLHKKSPFRKLVVDSTGLGKPILSHCRGLGLPVEGMNMHRKIQEEIFSNMKILIETRKVELPDNMNLLSSLNCIVSEQNRIGGYVFSHPAGTHDDLAYALSSCIMGS